MEADFSSQHAPALRWPAGWYRDYDRGGERWWDGETWGAWRAGGDEDPGEDDAERPGRE